MELKPSISGHGHLYTPSAPAACSSEAQPRTDTQEPKPGRKNSKKLQETRHRIYKGIRQKNGKWVTELGQPNNKSRDMAARAYDVATLALRGDSARSSSISDIKHAANEAAQGFGHVENCISSSIAEKVGEEPRNLFLDEEAIFNMPVLLDSMAEGLILTPLAMEKGFNWDGVEDAMDLNLWSY